MVGLLAGAPGASAGVLSDAVGSCDGQVLEQPFVPWGDPAQYVLVPDGDLARRGAGWQLAGAQVVDENEPWRVHGPGAPAALRLGAGAAAISPAMCVSVVHPTLRFFARNVGDPLGTLHVEVLFEDALGGVQSQEIGVVSGTGVWAPTLLMPVTANLLSLLPDGSTPVAFGFAPEGPNSAWLIDDIYVDPYCKG